MTAVEGLSIKNWWAEFEENPGKALDELLCGRTFMGYLEPNETDEILFRLFHNKGKKALHQLDLLMKDWFAANWGQNPSDLVTGRWINILQNAFIAVFRLNLQESASFLREIYTLDKSWLRGLYLAPSRDPEGDLLRTLALMQKDRALLPFWMRLCRQEEDLPLDYTSIAIMGLRKLPEKDGSPQGDLPEALFKGLIVLAETLGKSGKKEHRDFWLMEMRMIAALYPRSKQYWAQQFYPFVHHQPEGLPVKWLNKAIPKLSAHFKYKNAIYIKPPPPDELECFLDMVIKLPLEKIKEDLEIFLNEHRRYAYQTGDSSFLIKTFSEIAANTFKKDYTFALTLVEEASSWEPRDPFLSAQRANIEAYRGNSSLAASILWETERHFPENPHVKNQLARLIGKKNKPEIANTLYRQIAECFPQSEENQEDIFQTQSPARNTQPHYQPYEKDNVLIEKMPEKAQASRIGAKAPRYGILSSPSPGFHSPQISEIEIEIGEISLLLWESRRAIAEKKEHYKQQLSTAVEEILGKNPGNVSILLLKGLVLTYHQSAEAVEFLEKQVNQQPNILGFRLLLLRTKSLNGNVPEKTQWNELIRVFPARATIINLEYILCLLDNPKKLDKSSLKELEKLRKLLQENSDRLPFTLQKNEAWVKSIITNRLFKGIDTNSPLAVQSADTIKANFEENAALLQATVDQCILSAV